MENKKGIIQNVSTITKFDATNYNHNLMNSQIYSANSIAAAETLHENFSNRLSSNIDIARDWSKENQL